MGRASSGSPGWVNCRSAAFEFRLVGWDDESRSRARRTAVRLGPRDSLAPGSTLFVQRRDQLGNDNEPQAREAFVRQVQIAR
jgi:hypothetical protein